MNVDRKVSLFQKPFKRTYTCLLHLLNVADSSMMHECFQVFALYVYIPNITHGLKNVPSLFLRVWVGSS